MVETKTTFKEINREDIEKILKKNPVWISRLGIMMALAVTSIILFITFYIKYPIIISSRITIISSNENGLINGKFSLNKDKSDQVKAGQNFKIIFDKYSLSEYGFVKGKIESVSTVPDSNITFNVVMKIQDNFNTNKGKRINVKNSMEGNIEIITGEVPLMRKLLKSIRIIPADILISFTFNLSSS